MTTAAVLGAGSWGTVFSKILLDAGCDVTLWARRPELAEAVNTEHRNRDYMPDLRLPESLRATNDPEEAVHAAEVVVLAVPSQSLRANLGEWASVLPRDALLVSLMKGIEHETSKRMSEVIVEVADVPVERVVVVSGPNLARELAQEQPAATVVAGTDDDAAALVQQAADAPYLRPYTNPDVVGVELGGAVKNVIALAVGIAVGMGFGDNSRAGLITRGLAETARLGAALGAEPLTFAGLAGLGDLVATCDSPLSRNRTFGEHLGQGKSLEQVQRETKQTAEGVKSCIPLRDLARKHDVDMPITEHVAAVVHGDMTPVDMLRSLMARENRPE